MPDVSDGLPEYTSLVYGELRRLASQLLRRESAVSLQPTALVHEAYIQMTGWKGARFQNRTQFFGAAAFAMRRVLAEAGRRRNRQKRAGSAILVSLDAEAENGGGGLADIVAIDLALSRLEAIHPLASRVLEVRIFGGLTIPETAELLEVSNATVKRHWSTARAWLIRELGTTQ